MIAGVVAAAVLGLASTGPAAAAPSAAAPTAAAPVPTPSPTSTASQSPPPIAVRPPGSLISGPLVGVSADDGAKIVAYSWLDARTVDITIRSPAVGTEVVARILVPSGWKQTSTATWPLMMVLHGGADDYTSWTRETDIKQLSASWNAVVAMPDAGQQASYTDFYNGGKYGTPAWETFHTKEFIQILERAFGTNSSRAVAGLSSGGYGAFAYATREPQLWRFAASYSGTISIRTPLIRESLLAIDAAFGSAYNRFGVPILDERNWAAHDPYTNAAKLRGMGVWISSGYTGLPSTQDTVGWTPVQLVEVFSGQSAAQFDLKLNLLGIKHTTHLYALGEHAWAAWQRELHDSWPTMMAAIGAQQTR